jgi:hypothetical protein
LTSESAITAQVHENERKPNYEVVGEIIHLRHNYHFGPAKISMYLKRLGISRMNTRTSVRSAQQQVICPPVFAALEHAAGTLITLGDA